MSLGSGRYWITPTRRQEVAQQTRPMSPESREYVNESIKRYWAKKKAAKMATALGKSFSVKDGKIAKKPPRMIGKSRKQLEAKAKKDEAKWRKAK